MNCWLRDLQNAEIHRKIFHQTLPCQGVVLSSLLILFRSLSQRNHSLQYRSLLYMVIRKPFHYAVTTSVSLYCMLCQFFECMCEVWFNYHRHLVNEIYFHLVTLQDKRSECRSESDIFGRGVRFCSCPSRRLCYWFSIRVQRVKHLCRTWGRNSRASLENAIDFCYVREESRWL